MVVVEDEEIAEILRNAKTIAVVGCSRDPAKPAHEVPKYLQAHGYKIIPVNPFADEILGEKAFKTLSEVKQKKQKIETKNRTKIDVVEVFRPNAECPQIAREAVALDPKPKVFWMQLGIDNAEAAKLCEEHRVKVVANKCMMVEHERLIKK